MHVEPRLERPVQGASASFLSGAAPNDPPRARGRAWPRAGRPGTRGLTVGLLLGLWLAGVGTLPALSVLTYNINGNGETDWSPSAPHLQALGRELQYLQADLIAFNEVPVEHTAEFVPFVQQWLPGYHVATNSGSDGYIRSVIASRFPIRRSTSWLDGLDLTRYGYRGVFTRDLFEAEIEVPGYAEPVHLFALHLKAGVVSEDLARRAAEASAVSNYLVRGFLSVHRARAYLLAGDLNEDIFRPPRGSLGPVQRLANSATGLRVTLPRNPVTGDDRTISTRTSLFARFDYILPCGLLFSNLAEGIVFRTDVLHPRPPPLQRDDSRVASDHLPVLLVFDDPLEPFRITRLVVTPENVRLTWQTRPGRHYAVQGTTGFRSWVTLATNLTATTTNLTWQTSPPGPLYFFRVMQGQRP